jgi:DNA-binding beta-propeller fold protein YncE
MFVMGVRRLGSVVLMSLCVLAGSLLCGASAFAARGHVFSSAFGKAGAGDGEFSGPAGVAVNEANGGDVYVVDRGNSRVEYFTSTGAYAGKFDGSGTDLAVEVKAAPTGRFSAPESIAIDNDPSSPSFGDVYVADIGHEAIDKFSSTGAYIGQLTETSGGSRFGEIYGLAVDPNGGLWVYQGNRQIDTFDGSVSNGFVSSFEAGIRGRPYPGLAVDSSGDFYAKGEWYGISKFNDVGETLIEEFDSLTKGFSEAVPSGVAVDLSSGDVYIDNADGANAVGHFTSNGSLSESFGSEHLSKGSGITVNAQTGAVYIADSASNVVDVFPLEPLSPPRVEDESTFDVASGSATFSARIDPRGPVSEYRFEYGTTTAYGESLPIPDVGIGSGFEPQTVSVHAQDLSPSTVYHFRVVAHNELGEVTGEDRTFTTQPLGGQLMLPDGRTWELVTPPNKEGASIYAIDETPLQAAADGGAITYRTTIPTEPEPQGYVEGMRVFSSRGSSGWSSLDIGPPYRQAPHIIVGKGEAYRLFSADLTHGLMEPVGAFNPLSPEDTERTLYLHSDYASVGTRELCVSACYRPLVTASNVPPGTAFGGSAEDIRTSAKFVTATPDLSHVLLQSDVALTSTPTPTGGDIFYEWSSGHLQLVSEVPESEGGGAAQGIIKGQRGPGGTMHSMSNDGRRVFWSGASHGGQQPGLYMRDTSGHETVRLDVVEGNQTNANLLAPQFSTASSDGSHAFFTDAERLTEDSTAVDGSIRDESRSDLYEYDLNAPAGKKLTDLTADQNAGEAADVQGVLGASEDGSYVYFVANGVLAPGAAPGKCGREVSPSGTTCNLYVAHDGSGGWERPKLVTVLSGEDQPDWSELLIELTARVSPNGRYLAFMSDRRVAGYDNRDALSGKPDEEVYLYDANTGRSVCASCNPTGARPSGVEFLRRRLVSEGLTSWDSHRWLAANVPGWTGYENTLAQYQSRYLSDSGRLFFDSGDALVPQDVNNTEDVYEYEPSSVGGCAASVATFSERSGGCVSLISTGTSSAESAFLDASETGEDVFFLTSSNLSVRDYDSSFDIYDARKCEGTCVSSPIPPPPCSTGDSCKSAPSPQPAAFGAPSSATFSGAGNVVQAGSPAVSKRALSRAQKLAGALRACAKKRLRAKRVECRRLARRHYGRLAAGKSNRSVVGRGSSAAGGRGGKR